MKKSIRLFPKLKIFLLIIGSLFFSSLLTNNVFIGYTPRIRKNLGNYLAMKISLGYKELVERINGSYYLKKEMEKKVMAELANKLKPVTKGIRAASKDNYGYVEFKLNEIEWDYITFTLKNGKKVTVRYPKGGPPPLKETVEDFESLYSMPEE